MRGFTLIELLVVIAILAVLATATVLVLNPAELLKQSRDSTRIGDLSALHDAIALWTADVLNGSAYWTSVARCTATSTKPGGATGCTYASSSVTNGTGWIPIDFTKIAAGSPLSDLPVDPNNGATTCKGVTTTMCQYAFAASATVGVYELDAQMESAKFYTGGSSHITDKDGGTMPDVYEVGSDLTQI